MDHEKRLSLLYQVAHLFYREGKKKFEISQAVGCSPTQVANLLQEAKDEGIVTISVQPGALRLLQEALQRKYPFLREVVVIPSQGNHGLLRRCLGEQLKAWYERFVAEWKGSERLKVAVSGGNTVFEMVNQLEDRDRDIEIYPAAIIGRGPTILHVDPMVNVTLLWLKSGRRDGCAHYVTIPPLEKQPGKKPSEFIRDELRAMLTRHMVKQVYAGLAEVDVVISSLGTVEVDEHYAPHSYHTTVRLLGELGIKRDDLKKAGAVGDLSYSFMDSMGKVVRVGGLERFFLSLSLEQIRKIAADPTKRVVVVAGGRFKREPLRAVLRGKLCNVLFTDAEGAAAVLDTERP